MDKQKLEFLVETIRDHLALGRTIDDVSRRMRAVASDEEIKSALELFQRESEALKKSRAACILTHDRDSESWYLGPSEDPSSHWQLLVETLKRKSRPWSEEMINSLNHGSSAVVAHLAPPKSQTPNCRRGLVLGYVQSGKTANFSAVISKSVDAGYKLVVVLAGMHNILRLQTQARLHEEIVAPKESACTTLTKVDENGDFQKKQFVSPNRALSGSDGFTLVVLKKNSAVLRNFNSWLDEASEETLKHCPTLVIDDESDQASVNTNAPAEDPTAINDHIRKMIRRFSVVSYVGYTATPFANILIDASVSDDLFPRDFVVTLDKPTGYIGAEELFGRDAVEPDGPVQGIPVIRLIPQGDALAYSPGKKGAKPKQDVQITASMLEALDAFVLGCSARLCRGQWKQHMTMLIHTSHLVSNHQNLKEIFDEYVLHLKLDRKENSEDLKARLGHLWERDFQKVSELPLFKAASPIQFEMIWKNSEKLIERIEIIMENHASEERLTYARPDPFWGVVIGGNTLSRGLTLEGLTTSYFIRGSKGYDTLLQMGRWFGYRPDYVDLTRIYVTEELQSKFFHLATVEQEIRDEIRTMAANFERPIDVALNIRTHPSMTITSNLKMRTAQSSALTYSAAKVQALYMNLSDSSLLKRNLDVAVSLLDRIEKYGGISGKPGFEDLSSCLLYRNVAPELILQFIENYTFSPANIRFSAQMLSDYVRDLNNAKELLRWSVGVFSTKSGNELELGTGRKVHKLDRSIVKHAVSERDPDARHIKVLTSPRDEIIDLIDVLPGTDLKNTEQVFTENPNLTDASIRQSLRPKDRGLLMLYPLNPNCEMPESERNQHIASMSLTMPLIAAQDAIGVAFVFPKTANSKSTYRYVVNGTI